MLPSSTFLSLFSFLFYDVRIYGFAVSSDTLRAIHRTSVLKKMSFEVKRARKTTTFAMGVHFSKLRASVFRRRATSSSSLICFPRNGGARSVTSRVMHRDSLENRTRRDRFPLPCRCTYDENIYICTRGIIIKLEGNVLTRREEQSS